jgi:hypothetical protein
MTVWLTEVRFPFSASFASYVDDNGCTAVSPDNILLRERYSMSGTLLVQQKLSTFLLAGVEELQNDEPSTAPFIKLEGFSNCTFRPTSSLRAR